MATYQIKITKAGNAKLDVDDTTFDNDTFAAIFAEGLKACLNAKMTKITGLKDMDETALAEAHSAAMEIATKNLADLKSGKYKFPGSKAKTAEPRAVINEAMRLAREFIRDQITAANMKVSHFPAKDITAAAKEIHVRYVEEAKANLAKREAVPEAKIDLAALGLKPDPEKLAKAEAAKVTRKENLSKTQAGKTAARTTKAKPKADIASVLGGAAAGHKPETHGGAVH